MLTVLEAITKSTEYLTSKGVENPRTNVELMLASILKCGRLELYLKFDQPLNEDETLLLREHIARRGKHEPLQYITGEVEFYGYPLMVNEHVLIPRQETEIVVEAVIEQCKEKQNISILDIGTGSGNIIISLAKELPGNKYTALDVSRDALKVAYSNVKTNGLLEVMEFKNFSILDLAKVKELGKFDVIVSNPPYINLNDFNGLQTEVKEFEPRIALTDEGTGFKFYDEIAKIAKEQLLNKDGILFFESGDDMADEIANILKTYDYNDIEFKYDFIDKKRVVWGKY